MVAVENCRNIGKKDMRRNEATPEIRVDPDTYQVWVDGEKVGSEPLADAADGPALFPVLIAVAMPLRGQPRRSTGPRTDTS